MGAPVRIGAGIRRRLTTALLAVVGGMGCALHPGTPRTDFAPPAVKPAVDHRERTLANGFITFELDVPRDPPGPKPVVIAFVGEPERLHEVGIATVRYQIHWDVIVGKQPEPPPPPPAPADASGSPPLPGAPKPDTTPTAAAASPPAPTPPVPAPRTYGAWLLASPDPATVGKGYFELITMQSDDVVPRVLDALEGEAGIDMGRVGIVGTSSTGFVVLQAVARDRRLRVAVALVTTGEYPCFLAGSALGMNGAEPLRLAPAYRRFLLQHDPARHPQRLVHAALLMVNGRDDKAMPLGCVEATTAAFARSYARAGVPERLRTVVFDVGHNLGPDAAFETMAWLYRWLRPALPAASAGEVPGERREGAQQP